MEFRDTRAIYLQIADLVSSSILTARWGEGDRIPSVRELAAELTVNPATVLRGYDYLCAMEVISVQRGVGYVVEQGARARVLSARREAFFREELPAFKAKMEELNIDWNEVITNIE